MKTLTFVFSLLCFYCVGQIPIPNLQYYTPYEHGKYKVTPGKYISWGTMFTAGLAGGMEAGFQFDHRRSFERKYNVNPYGFFGSQSWRQIYINGDPNQGVKSGFRRRLGSIDFYHLSNKTMRFGYIGGSFTLGYNSLKTNTKWWHYVLDIGIGMAVSTIGQNIGMYYIRN